MNRSYRATLAVSILTALALGACQPGLIGDPATRRGEALGTAGAGGPILMDPAPGVAGANGGAGATNPSSGAGGAGGAGGAAIATGTAGAGPLTGAAGAVGTAGSGPAAGGATGRDAAVAETTPPVTVAHCKRGEAYAGNSIADLQTLSKGMSWWYNWTTSPEKAVANDFTRIGVEFVPMIWGGDPDVATVVKQIPTSAKYLLGFNEPNFGAQSHITAPQAAALWPKIQEIARQRNLKIGSPAPNYCAGDCNDTDPIHYLDTFFAACTGCKVDFIAAHWYACTGDALKFYLAKLKKYNLPIWLTEFSCMDAGDHSVAGEEKYMRDAVTILEADPAVFRYAWFTGRWPNPSGISLLGASGVATELGNLYMTLPATASCP